jgi:hypothetical protein
MYSSSAGGTNPKILAIPSPDQLAAANLEEALSQLMLDLEKRVMERTLALKIANELLQQENLDRPLRKIHCGDRKLNCSNKLSS